MSENIFQIKFIYILLNFINILIFWYIGKKLQKTQDNQKYWQLALWCIISYAVVMGLRFGHMIDYNVYYERYVGIGRNFFKYDYDISFKAICWLLYNIGVSYSGFICLCSITLISSTLFLLKNYPRYQPWALLLFLWETHNAENFIRWFLAFSFFLYFIGYLQSKKIKLSLIFAALSVTTHIGTIILITAVFALVFIKKQIIPTWIAEILFILSLFYGSVNLLSYLTPYIQFLGMDAKSAQYAANFDNMIAGEYGNVGIRDALSFTNNLRIILAYSIPILTIPHLLKKSLIKPIEANLFIIGIILNPILGQIEILNRFGEGLQFFSVIVSSASYVYILQNKKKLPKYIVMLCIISMMANMWPIISNIINRNNWWEMLFIWDANGRNTLPLGLYIDYKSMW